jgi:predicted Zn-dependent protease with MMP-like domain
VVSVEPIDVDTFEVLVADALATIPDELREHMVNVAILIDDESPPGSLYGLYEGIPLTSSGQLRRRKP